jgi:integrating conjugative element protein (TIGR03759 family)
MHPRLSKILLLAGLSALLPAAQADNETSTAVSSEMQSSRVAELDIQKAKQWGLETTEWQRFRQLMDGPLGTYSPNLDPLSALGIEARTEQERTRYAELQAQMETARITKLLAYQNAYDQAYKRLYPDLLPVNLLGSDTPQMSPAKASDRPAVFVELNCPPCDVLVKTLQREGKAFDLYLIGSKGSDDSIRAWALKAGIAPGKVRSRQITLNHDAGRWISLGGTGAFPAVLRQINGQWVRQ